MSNFKNPYLSTNDDFIMKKNYKIICPLSTSPSYNSTSTFQSNRHLKHDKNLVDQKVEELLRQNPFQSKQNNQKKVFNYSNNSPIATEKYLHQNSNNRQQTFRSSSLNNHDYSLGQSRSRNALQISNTSIESRLNLGNNNKHSYYSGNSNQWNSQRWKKQLQKKDRKDLQVYGPQALRYKHYDYKTQQNLPNKYKNNLNNQYYSITHLPSIEDHQNIRQTPVFYKHQHQKLNKNQIFQEDDFVIQKKKQAKKTTTKRCPSQPLFKNMSESDSNHHFQNKNRQSNAGMMNSIKQNQFENLQSKLGSFNMAEKLEYSSKHSDTYSMDKSQYDMYKSKCEGSDKGYGKPLAMNAFDSDIDQNMEGSSVFKMRKYGTKTDSESDDYRLIKVIKPRQSKRHVQFLQTQSNVRMSKIQHKNRDKPHLQFHDYPSRIAYKKETFYKIQLTNGE